MANALRSRQVKFSTAKIKVKTRTAMKKAMDQVVREMNRDLNKILNRQGAAPALVSAPGTAPMKQTGNLQNTTKVARVGFKTIVIKTPQYGIWLDGGTTNIKRRPYITRVIHNRSKKWLARIGQLQKRFMK